MGARYLQFAYCLKNQHKSFFFSYIGPKLPHPMASHSMVAFQDKIITVGGTDGSSSMSDLFQMHTVLREFFIMLNCQELVLSDSYYL